MEPPPFSYLPKSVYSPAQARALLQGARRTDHLGFWVLSLFTGLRTAEIKRLGSSPACWSYIHLPERAIELPSWMTKTRARLVPLNATAMSWLPLLKDKILYPADGARKLAEFGREILGHPREGAWANAGRRSFISYSLSLPHASYVETARIVGSSERMLRGHYFLARMPEAAEEFFRLTPDAV